MGRAAHSQLLKDPSPAPFTLLLAASGGPRWLGLVGIDRALRRFLSQRTARLPLLGASSGAWRMAALTSDQDGSTYDELIEEYIGQRYEGKPTPQEVSAVCRGYLTRLFTEQRVGHSLQNSAFQLNFSTALMAYESPTKLQTLSTLAKATLFNAVDRRLLGRHFKRALFSVLPHPNGSPLETPFDSIPQVQVRLQEDNFVSGLLATGSIPTVLSGESAIPASVAGHHYDGGLLDYHFEIETRGPILYPHFSDDPIPGWMDRFFPFRRISRRARDELCIVMPSKELLARFPMRDYPSRHDFKRLANDERIGHWRAAVKENELLEKELALCLDCGDLALVAEPL